MNKTNYSVARVQTYTRANILKAERHNERKNESYSNMNVDLTKSSNNVLRGLKDNAKVFDELIIEKQIYTVILFYIFIKGLKQ